MNTRCVIYVRMSLDQRRKGENVAMHAAECREYAADQGWSVVEVFDKDSSVSASKFSTKPRLDYERMIRWLAADTDTKPLVVLTTEMERLYRKMPELLDLIRMAERSALAGIHCTNDESYDLSTTNGIHAAIGAVNNAMRESGKISDRQKRKHRARAAAGAYSGARPFGYQLTRVDTEAGYEAVSLTPDEAEGPLVREAAERILAGESLRSVCRDWAARGIKTTRGNPFLSGTLKEMLLARRNIGEREHRPGSHGGKLADRVRLAAAVTPALWEPLLDRDTWELLAAALTDPSRDTRPAASRDSYRTYLLSGMLFCECGSRMSGDYSTTHRIRRYHCASGNTQPAGKACHATRSADRVDEHVRDVVLHWLRPGGAYDVAIAAELAKQGDMTELLAARRAAEADLARYDADYKAGNLSGRAHVKFEAAALAEIQRVDRLLARRRARSAVAVPAERGPQLRSLWDVWAAAGPAGLVKQRTLIAVLLDKVTLLHTTHRGRQAFDPDCVQLTPGSWADGVDAAVLDYPRPSALTPYEHAVWEYLTEPSRKDSPVPPSEIAAATGVEATTLHYMLRRWAARGVVEQVRAKHGPRPSLYRVAGRRAAA